MFLLPGILALLLGGCVPSSFAQTPFQREAQDAASLLSATALTIELFQTDRLDHRYAEASIEIYARMVSKIASFAGVSGAPDAATVRTLDGLVADASRIANEPCLHSGLQPACDWRSQVAALRSQSRALTEASS